MNLFSALKNNRYWYLYALMIAFLLLKMARGVFGVASSGGGIWNAIQILFVFIGIVYFFTRYNNKVAPIGVFLFFSIWVMFVAFINMINHPINSLSSWFYFFSTPCAPFVLLIFYCVAQKGDFRDYSFLIKTTYYVLIAMFYYSMTNYREMDSDEFIAFSDIYYPLALLPIVLFLTKPQRSIIPIFAIIVGIIVSGKRGGLVMVALVAFIYYFIGNKRGRGRTIFMLLLFVAVAFFASYIIEYIDSLYGLHTIDRMESSIEDGGSGRLWRWGKIWDVLGMSSFWELLFGHGFGAVYDLVGGRAHNDFLEVFYNFGFMAFVFYILFYLSIIILNIRQYRNKYPNAKFLTCSIAVALVLAMVSFFIVEPTYVLSSMFTTGLLLGDWSKNRNIVTQ